MTRVPPGHPEGYLEGFANIYKEAAAAILAAREGKAPDPAVDLPDRRGRREGRCLRGGVRPLQQAQRGLGHALRARARERPL